MDQVMLTVTRLGDPDIMVPLTSIGVVWLWWRWRWRIAAIFLKLDAQSPERKVTCSWAKWLPLGESMDLKP
jgi:hypothetical protein